MIWVYLGAENDNNDKSMEMLIDREIPLPSLVTSDTSVFTRETLDNPLVSFFRYLPYGVEIMVENAADPEHLNYAHHGTEARFDRKNGGKVQVHVTESTANGNIIEAQFGALNGAFIPPCTTYYYSESEGVDLCTILIAIPVTKTTCRLFFVTYLQFQKPHNLLVPLILKLMPKWADHLHRNNILDGDKIILHRIQHALGNPPDWKKQYLTVRNSDAFVVEIRKFFDLHRDTMPWAHGYSSTTDAQRSPSAGMNRAELFDRFHSHTEHCAICSGAYKGFSKGVFVASLTAKVASTALISVLLATYLGNPALLQGAQLISVRNTVVSLCVTILVALRLEKLLTWYKQEFVRSEEARRRLLTP